MIPRSSPVSIAIRAATPTIIRRTRCTRSTTRWCGCRWRRRWAPRWRCGRGAAARRRADPAVVQTQIILAVVGARDHAGRRRQPGARVRHRRRGQPDSLSLEDRRPEGRGRHALRARGGARGRRRPLRAGRCSRTALHRRPAVGDRVVRAADLQALRLEDQGRARRPTRLRPKVEAILRRYNCRSSCARSLGRTSVSYDVQVPLDARPTGLATPSSS